MRSFIKVLRKIWDQSVRNWFIAGFVTWDEPTWQYFIFDIFFCIGRGEWDKVNNGYMLDISNICNGLPTCKSTFYVLGMGNFCSLKSLNMLMLLWSFYEAGYFNRWNASEIHIFGPKELQILSFYLTQNTVWQIQRDSSRKNNQGDIPYHSFY